jgi:Family of unknown function (DUF6085)
MTLIVHPDVQGYCPMGCGQTLFLGEGGFITCSLAECPRPDAATLVLEEQETDHVVVFSDDDTFTIMHPLRERLDGELMTCPLHTYLVDLTGPPVSPGQYHVSYLGVHTDHWEFEEIEESEIN